jgi:hypothetical protein
MLVILPSPHLEAPSSPSTPKWCEPKNVPQLLILSLFSPHIYIWIYQRDWEHIILGEGKDFQRGIKEIFLKDFFWKNYEIISIKVLLLKFKIKEFKYVTLQSNSKFNLFVFKWINLFSSVSCTLYFFHVIWKKWKYFLGTMFIMII